MMAPTVRYMPPPAFLKSCLSERTSFLRLFFSDELSSDLSIVLISFNLVIIAFASADKGGFGSAVAVTGTDVANDCVGIKLTDRHTAINKTEIFFIIFNLDWFPALNDPE